MPYLARIEDDDPWEPTPVDVWAQELEEDRQAAILRALEHCRRRGCEPSMLELLAAECKVGHAWAQKIRRHS